MDLLTFSLKKVIQDWKDKLTISYVDEIVVILFWGENLQKKRKITRNRPRKSFFFMDAFLVESVFSFFFSWQLSFFFLLDRFLGRERVFSLFFLFSRSFSWSKTCFLVFLFPFIKFSTSGIWSKNSSKTNGEI